MRKMIYIFYRIVVFLVVLKIAFYFAEPFVFYHPVSKMEGTPGQFQLKFTEKQLVTQDGSKISSWWIPSDSTDAPVILFCHGNAGNMSHRLSNVAALHNMGWSVIIFDYHGFGTSEGRPSETRLYSDAKAVYEELISKGIPTEKIIWFGRSLGGAVASYGAEHFPSAGLILESTFTSAEGMAKYLYWPFPVQWLVWTKFPTLDRIRRIQLPLLILHGDQDSMIPIRMGKELFEASASSSKSFHKVKGGEHNTTFSLGGTDYWNAFQNFMNGLKK